jgi:protocatechuate 3,4-dioxygenase beta subunit
VPCALIPEQEVGPFYVADELIRSAIAEGKPGVPLALRIAFADARTCAPLPNAAIDLWHCDAMGQYSGFTSSNLGGPPPGPPHGVPGPGHGGPPPNFGPGGPPAAKPTDHLTFLRGIQITGADGIVNFQTIFPGFYQGRVNHVHFKVRLGGHPDQKTYAAGHTAHVGQLFFPEDVSLALMANEPYASHHIHRTTQAEDGVFTQQHGDLAVSHIAPIDSARAAAGYQAQLTVFVDPTATPAPVMQGPPDRLRT